MFKNQQKILQVMELKSIKEKIPKELYAILEKDIKTLRPAQVKAIEKGLLEGKSLLVCTPTASGKNPHKKIITKKKNYNKYHRKRKKGKKKKMILKKLFMFLFPPPPKIFFCGCLFLRGGSFL